MPKFQAGRSGNPSGRPRSAVGLRAVLLERYGDNAEVLVDRLEAFSRSKNLRVAFGATELLMQYHVGRPEQAISLDVQATTTRQLTPQMLALLSTDELRMLRRINARLSPEDDADRLLPPDGSDGAANPGASPETSGL